MVGRTRKWFGCWIWGMVGWLVGRLGGFVDGWSWLVDLVDGFVDGWSVGGTFRWLVGWSAECLAGWLSGTPF